MTYNKPELEIENFDIIEEITVSSDGNSGASATGGDNVATASAAADNSIGSDLIIG